MKTRIIVSALFLLLAGCSYNPFIDDNKTTGDPAGALIGATVGAGGVATLGGPRPLIGLAGIGGGIVGYYMTTLRYDSGGIIQSGGQVYRVGDFVGINIPSDKLFEPNSSEFLPQAPYVLDSVATVLQRYPTNDILISGNTSGFFYSRWEQRLSERRAKAVAAYLWNAGINNFKGTDTHTRHLNYVGYGDYFPISHTYTNNGIRQNSHIQVTSFPSSACLDLDKKHVAMRNVGTLYDNATYKDDDRPCGNGGC